MNILTVSQLNRYVKLLLEEDSKLADIYIKGEISNFVNHFRSGHFYFTLKDETASVRVAMFKTYASDLRFEPENGMAVLLRANVGVYERDGVYQLYATDMQPDGAGALAVAFEQQKRKLSALGMFDERYKKPIPVMPVRIGLITSETGAAVQDVVNVLSRRYPLATLVLSPAQVQGREAANAIVKSLKNLDAKGNCDVIIIARGGGSAEDLQSFNDEGLAFAVFEAKTPVISAVGHEVDYTICDFVADLRAPTPSAAAELVAEPVSSILNRLENIRESIADNAYFMLQTGEDKLEKMRKNTHLASPMGYVLKNQQKLDFFSQSLYNKKHLDLGHFENEISSRARLLESLSPLKVLARGYSAAFRDNKAVTSAEKLNCGDELDLRFRDGSVKTRVLEVYNEEKS